MRIIFFLAADLNSNNFNMELVKRFFGFRLNQNISSTKSEATAFTFNGNTSFATIGKPYLDYYGGVTRQTDDEDILRLAQQCLEENIELALATFFQKRDCRGGAGERKPFILSLTKIAQQELRHNLYSLIPIYGYWDDLNALARIIPEDQAYIAEMFAQQLLKNIQSFVQKDTDSIFDRGLEKWLPTEGQQDDKNWNAVNKIINAFNLRLNDIEPIQLRYSVCDTLLTEYKKKVEKIDVIAARSAKYLPDGTLQIDNCLGKIEELTRKYQHLLDKARNLPIILNSMMKTGYRKWCTFARAYSEVVEHFKSIGKWNLINYPSVPSIAFDRTKKQFAEHDAERFLEFVSQVKQGSGKINVGQLMPYQLLSQENSEVRDEQWRLIVKETKEFYAKVDMDNVLHPKQSIHVADVSGSMTGGSNPRPIDVAISLAILMSEVSGKALYTFSAEPCKYEPTWTSLTEAQSMINDSNYNTNFRALIDRIYDDCLAKANQQKVDPSEIIPGAIYIYTDGGFDKMCSEKPTTATDYIKKKFDEFNKVPLIIFWNVAGNIKDFAVNEECSGMVQLAGFSKDLYQSFTRLTSLDEIGPEAFFRQAVLNERYEQIVEVYRNWKTQSHF